MRKEDSRMPKTHVAAKKVIVKLVIDKDLLKFFPKPDRMAQPVPTEWEQSSSEGKPTGKRKHQVIQNSY